MAPEILKAAFGWATKSRKRAVAVGVAGLTLVGAGYLCATGQLPSGTPDLNHQNPAPTEPLQGTEAANGEVSTQQVPASTQEVANSISTPVPGGQNSEGCITTLGLPIRKGILTPLQEYKCIGRGPNGESIWEKNGKIYITTRISIDQTLIDP